MKSSQREISDLVWLGKRIDKVLAYLTKENSSLKEPFLEYIKEYFIPIVKGDGNQEDEDYYFEQMDNIIDELETLLSQIFETLLKTNNG
jgi:hypothetical protein